jgi:hypothetical protein
MYSVDAIDQVVKRKDVPQSSVGAPCPMMLSGEHFIHLAYFLQETPSNWDGSTARVVDEQSGGESCALVRFSGAIAYMFGPPNDEAFSGHPLASRGLEPYSVFEINQSSWLRTLERMNSVHPYHRAERFAKLNHYVFSFHDSVFECIAERFELSQHSGSVSSVLRASWPAG